MKFILISVVAVLAAGQQFQQSPNSSPAVWVARQGFFQQGDSNRFDSSRSNARFQENNFQTNSFVNQNNNLLSRSFSGSRRTIRPDAFQNRNQFQFDSTNNRKESQRSDSFQTNNRFQKDQNNRFQVQSNNRNQFQFTPSNSLLRSSQNELRSTLFPSNSFQQNQNRFQSGSFQQNQQDNQFQGNQNNFQSNTFQQNNANRFQLSNNNQFRNNEVFQRDNSNRNFQFNTFQQQNRNAQQQGLSQFRSFDSSRDFSEGTFEPLNLPSGASSLFGSVSSSFSCSDRPYGYYADQENSCRIFHVCNPSLFSNGQIQTYQYSFMCGEGTLFDQKELTCVNEFEASPCQEAINYYSRNEEFGRPEEKF